MDQKSYEMCFNHADELQALVKEWGERKILKREQISEAGRLIEKAGPLTISETALGQISTWDLEAPMEEVPFRQGDCSPFFLIIPLPVACTCVAVAVVVGY